MEQGAAGLMAGLTLPHSSGTRDSSQEHHDIDLVLAQAGAHQKHPQSTPDKAAFCSHSASSYLHSQLSCRLEACALWPLNKSPHSSTLQILIHQRTVKQAYVSKWWKACLPSGAKKAVYN